MYTSRRDSCASWNEVDRHGVELLLPYCYCYGHSTSLLIPVTNLFDLCSVCCFGSVHDHDHGRVPVDAGISGDYREYRISHFECKFHVKNWRLLLQQNIDEKPLTVCTD